MSQPSGPVADLMGIGELAIRSGVAATALRFYDQVGLLSPAAREGGRRRYGSEALARLRVIRLCKAAGFSLEEIAELYGDSAPGRPASRALAEAKLRTLDDQIAELTIAREILLLGLRCSCRSLDECRCDVHKDLAGLVPAADERGGSPTR